MSSSHNKYNVNDWIVEGSARIEAKGEIRAGQETVEVRCCRCSDGIRRIRTSRLEYTKEPVICKACKIREHGTVKSVGWLSEATVIRLHPDKQIVPGSLRFDEYFQRQVVEVVCSAEGCEDTLMLQTQSLHASLALCEYHRALHNREKSRQRTAALRKRRKAKAKKENKQ